jgi:predicted DNA-binding transcriptional regulator AlpA
MNIKLNVQSIDGEVMSEYQRSTAPKNYETIILPNPTTIHLNEHNFVNKEFINYNEASFITSIPLSTLRKKVSAKQIPFIKIGKSVYFSVHELVDWVNSHREGDCHD